MNGAVLLVVLLVYAVIGLVFGIYPELDLRISSLFFDQQTHSFMLRPWIITFRDSSMWALTAVASLCVIALVAKVVRPRQKFLIPIRAILLLLTVLAVGPGLLTNGILKNYWGRPRPIDVQQFGGQEHFVAWWDPRGDCPRNCSFVSGDVSGATWTLAVAALTPPAWRIFSYSVAVAFGASIGLARLAFGGHFFTDVAFAGLSTFVITWIVHGLIYRWKLTRLTDEVLETAIEKFLVKLQRAISAIAKTVFNRFLMVTTLHKNRRS